MDRAIDIRLRPGTASDLEAVNAVIDQAIMTWDLPDRVKRLSLPSYRYHTGDLSHLTLVVAETSRRDIVAAAAMEPADPADTPAGRNGLLLHGIYVAPERHRQGVGSKLLDAAVQAARDGRFDGLLVKANRDARRFFFNRGLRPLPVENPNRDYPHRFWYDLKEGQT